MNIPKKRSGDHLILIASGGLFTALFLFILIGKLATKATWSLEVNITFGLFFVICTGLLLIGIKLYKKAKIKEQEDAEWRLRKIKEQMEKDATGGY